MRDRDAAKNTQPGGGNSTLNETTIGGAEQSLQPRGEDARKLRRILLVEDDASLARLEAGMLAARGYAVAIATSGEMAITTLQQAIPDLVLLDLDLSGTITGWDVLRVLRS